METFFNIALLFVVGSVIGWVVELVFKRYASIKQWINPGFLTGPYVPLYGVGVCAMYAICMMPVSVWLKTLMIFVMMSCLEFFTGFVFVQTFGIRLWNYSKRWGNFRGIICPLFFFIWGIVGVVFLFFIFPHMPAVLGFLSGHSSFLFCLGLICGVMLVDSFVSFKLLSKIKGTTRDLKGIVEFEQIKAKIKFEQTKVKKSTSFLFPFRSDKPIKQHIREMIVRQRRDEVKSQVDVEQTYNEMLSNLFEENVEVKKK